MASMTMTNDTCTVRRFLSRSVIPTSLLPPHRQLIRRIAPAAA
eukprot:CAMPEP_0172538132 /NCGR_PEP_ID=MMETSP1067-20121228/9595_1 /TAXON_ID=265564 ORGANISM="Thalassiosira punctigera, Strain Tpunct2005C2" /NCGR_SAMPLE_ID=MMETSP1067 /ASSEMBLY_ACC=CAM_ASM_000444 /LENGTH=42 /DNA_ID= /DNA_START= /DNA_END= /DNA_ORIENTATION=